MTLTEKITKRKSRRSVWWVRLAAFALLVWLGAAQAAIVTWQTPQYITGDTNVATNGTYVSSIVAAAASSVPTSITVNGVTFLNDAFYAMGGFWGVGYTGFSGSNPAGLSANYNSLLNGAAPSSATSATLTINGLAQGATYLVQLWVADYRSYITPAKSETINGSGALAFADGSNPNKFSHGSFVIGTFTADTTNQTFTFNTAPQFNVMQLRLLSSPGPSAVINWTNVFQRIDGFGAACSSMSGISVPQADLLFSTNIGAGLSLVRAGPHGTNGYAGEITVCQAAQSRGARIWATAYDPPTQYITDNGVVTNYFVSSVTNYQNYAACLAGFAANFKSNGINLLALSIQNEPDNSSAYLWTGQQMHDFIPYLSSALAASNCASTLIMLPEEEGWGFSRANVAMNDTTTSNLVGILAAHNYGNPPATTPVMDFGTPCPKPVWMSEHYVAGDDSITNGLAVVQELNFFLTVVNASSYGYLWLDNSIIRGAGTLANNPGKPAKRLFATGNYSRFARPGYYRIGVALNSSMLLSAFKDPASSNFVIVAANPTASAVNQSFTLTNFPVSGPLRAWVTSDTQSLANQCGAIAPTNGSFSYLLPAYSVISFVYQPFQTNPPTILQQPVSQASVAGGTVSFSVQTAGGTAPLQYQWFFNGTNAIANATNASVAVTSVNTTNVGSYSVIVSNALGSVTSSPVTLTLIAQTDFVMTGEDGYADASFSRIGFWVNSTNSSPATSPPTNGYTYSSIYTVRTPFTNGTFVFGGNSLNLMNGGGNLLYKGYGAADTVSGNFILSGGYIANGQGNSPTITGTIQVASPSAIAPTFGRLLKIASTLSGNAPLENGRGAPGIIAYSGNNVGFTGSMLVNGGAVVQASAQSNLGGNPAVFNPGQLTLDNGTLQLKASFALNNPNSGVTLGTGGGTFDVSNLVLTVSNPITGPGNLICAGSGTLTLAGTNTYSGDTTIGADGNSFSASGVQLRLGSDNALPNGVGKGNFVFGTNRPAILDLYGHNVQLNGLTGGTNAVVDNTTGGGIYNLTIGNNDQSGTFGGVIRNSSGSITLTKTGGGGLTLSGTNTYTGGTIISAGTVNAMVAGALGLVGGTTVNGTLNLTAGAVAYNGLTNSLNGSGTVNFALGTGSGSTSLNGNNSGFTGTLNFGTNGLTGAVAGAGAGKIQMNGALSSSATVNVFSNATVYVNTGVTQPASITLYGGDTGETLGQLRLELGAKWSGSVTLAGSVAGAGDGTVGSASGTGTISGSIGGAQPLIKVGSGTIVLSGTNTYTGNTTVKVGTLEISQPTLAMTSTVSVSNSAVLKLSFSTTNRVAALVLNGVSQTQGVYNSTTGSPYIAGSGALLVGPPINLNSTNILAAFSSGSLVVSWPADHTGWTLMSQTNNLSKGVSANTNDWLRLTSSTGTNRILIPISSASQGGYYRLVYP